ncbi:MAG: DNA/RNA non-specific endonuclease [Lewinellaceae bacterium]|nr:DNA/RNA non-specific endonuclease [Lewinellaceae bacterium]
MNTLKPQLTVPSGHAGDIKSVACSPDGDLILTGSADATVKLWNKQGYLLHTFNPEDMGVKRGDDGAPIESACFSPDGNHAFTSGQTIALWDIRAKAALFARALYKPGSGSSNSETIHQSAFSEDGKHIYLRGGDYIATINAMDGKFSSPLVAFEYRIEGWSVGEALIAAYDWKKNLYLVEKASWKKNRLEGPFHDILDIRFFPDDERLLVFEREELEDNEYRLKGSVLNLKNGQRHLLTIKEEEEEITLSETLQCFFSADGGQFTAVQTGGPKILRWDANTYKRVGKTISPACEFKHSLFSAGDSGLIVWGNKEDYNFKTLSLENGEIRHTSRGMAKRVSQIKLSEDGTRLFALLEGSYEARMTKLAQDINPSRRFPFADSAIAISRDGKILAGGIAHCICIWKVDEAQSQDWMEEPEAGKDYIKIDVGHSVYHLALSPDGKTVAASIFHQESSDEFVKVYEVESRQLIKTLLCSTARYKGKHEGNRANSLCFSKDGAKLLAGYQSGELIIWNTQSWEKEGPAEEWWLSDIDEGGGHRYVYDASFLPEEAASEILTANRFEGIHTWEVKSRKITQTYKDPEETWTGADGVSYSADKSKVIAGNLYGPFKVWDRESGNLLSRFYGHLLSSSLESSIATCTGKNGSTIVFTAAGDNSICIWDAESGASLATLFLLNEADWAVITPSGLFDATEGAMEAMYYVLGTEIIELDQLKGRYWQPGLLPILLNLADGLIKKVDEFKEVALYPEVASMELAGKKLEVKLTERNGGLGKVNFFINHKMRMEDANPQRKTAFTIELEDYDGFFEPGENSIAIRCWNEEGWLPGQLQATSYDKVGGDTSPPALHALFVGTSTYDNPNLSLHYPDQDAAYLEEAITLVGKHLFEDKKKNLTDKVHSKLLTTQRPGTDTFSSKENIKNAFAAIAKAAKAQDVTFIYFSGHGANFDDGEKAQFYYLTHEITSDDLSDSGVREKATISSDELSEWANAIPARKQVMVFDTCYSGKLLDSLKSKNATDATRDRAMERMKDRTGTFLLTGSAADKVSYEASNYGQGLLTYALLMGMRGAALSKGANQAENSVDIMRLFLYSVDEVERLSKEFAVVQRPNLRAPRKIESFDIGIAPKETRARIKLAMPKPLFVRSNFMNQADFLDGLNISQVLDQYLTGDIGTGRQPKAVFIDVHNFPGAHCVRGLYAKTEDGYAVNGKLYKDDKSLGDISVTGQGMEDIVPKLGRAVRELVFPRQPYQIPTEAEVLLLEKGKKEDLGAIKGTPAYGYNPNFIGKGYEVPLPKLTAAQQQDIAKTRDGETEIKYQYYSVIQCKSRKFPFFAACNLDGEKFIGMSRESTKFIKDSRLPEEDQWGDSFYRYKFKTKDNKTIYYTEFCDRGHMAKREDTQWGDDAATAERGARLTFYFTNAIPQHYQLNGNVWCGLEDYIMEMAAKEKKKKGPKFSYLVNIFTGPVFQENDPLFPIERNGKKEMVKVPALFWKVVYYKRKSDKKLCYVGFLMGQKGLMEAEFGNYGIVSKDAKEKEHFLGYKEKEVYQVKVSFIESLTGLKFQGEQLLDPHPDERPATEILEKVELEKKGFAGSAPEIEYRLGGLYL